VNFAKADIDGAQKIWAVANTPRYLVKKLRADGYSSLVATTVEPQEIFDALRESVSQEPADVRGAVLPYFLLVCLALKNQIGFLREAARLPATGYRWYPEVVDILLKDSNAPTKYESGVISNSSFIFEPASGLSAPQNTQKFPTNVSAVPVGGIILLPDSFSDRVRRQ